MGLDSDNFHKNVNIIIMGGCATLGILLLIAIASLIIYIRHFNIAEIKINETGKFSNFMGGEFEGVDAILQKVEEHSESFVGDKGNASIIGAELYFDCVEQKCYIARAIVTTSIRSKYKYPWEEGVYSVLIQYGFGFYTDEYSILTWQGHYARNAPYVESGIDWNELDPNAQEMLQMALNSSDRPETGIQPFEIWADFHSSEMAWEISFFEVTPQQRKIGQLRFEVETSQ